MKIKRLPEDFQVEELTDFAPTDSGEFAFYRLTKRGLGTPEAIEAVLRRWKLDRPQVSFGGLKDRHAISKQYLTIRRGPRRDLRQSNFELEYLGQADRVFGPADNCGNRFRVVIRSLTPAEFAAAETAVDAARHDGLPNYFDDQRFGSLGDSGEFVARAWIKGDYERALWLALADATPLDRPRDKEEKRHLRECWGDWPKCLSKLARSPRQDILGFLRDRPTDFRGALARVPVDLRGLYVAAFQSYLWNRLLADFLRQMCRPDQFIAVDLKMGKVPFFTALSDETRRAILSTELPLPSSRIRLDAGPIKQLVDRSLGELGLAMREIRIKYPRDSFFSKGWRSATFAAAGLSAAPSADELYRDRQKLTLAFDLPRGSYATILIKRVSAVGCRSAKEAPDDLELDPHEKETEAAI